MIPSNYIELTALPLIYNSLSSQQTYLDTGIYPTNLEIDLLGYHSGGQGFFFGARNQNSQNSAGQLGLYSGNGSSNYFCYNNIRNAITSHLLLTEQAHFYINNNNSIWQTASYISTSQGTYASFTGTRTMYVGGINNAGSVLGGASFSMNGLIIKDNGVKVLDLIPCVDENGYIGAYDLVNESFISVTPATQISARYLLMEVTQSEGGLAYMRDFHGDLTKQMYGFERLVGISTNTFGGARLEAIPQEGYEFLNWTVNGDVISTDQNCLYSPTTNVTIQANFQKVQQGKDLNMKYFARVSPYGDDTEYYFVEVNSASIMNDGLQKSNSTIECVSIPSAVHINQAIELFTPKGKVVYRGFIYSIEGNTLNCRELLSAYDQSYIASTSTLDSTIYTVTKGVDQLLYKGKYSLDFNQNNLDSLLYRKMENLRTMAEVTPSVTIDGSIVRVFRLLSLYHENNQSCQMPNFTETASLNLEEYFQQLFNDFGVYVDTGYYNNRLVLKPVFYRLNEKLTLSDNYERISDVSVTTEAQETNVLVVYNSSGTTLRGKYAVKEDGTVEEYTSALPEYLGYDEYKSKLIMSDDNIQIILAQNLTNSNLNHKITFKVDLGGLVTFDSLKVGTPVDFYAGDKLYKSVITAMNFEVSVNSERIQNASITLGKVRTSLTSKLNRS